MILKNGCNSETTNPKLKMFTQIITLLNYLSNYVKHDIPSLIKISIQHRDKGVFFPKVVKDTLENKMGGLF